jgi:hypothetical protein
MPANAPLDEEFLRTYCGQVVTAVERMTHWLASGSSGPGRGTAS